MSREEPQKLAAETRGSGVVLGFPNQVLAMPLSTTLRVYFENAAGRVLEHPAGYVVFVYRPGPRQLRDFQALITYAGHLLVRNGWHRILGDQRQMVPLTAEERAWVVTFWQQHTTQHLDHLCAAVVLAQDVFARLAASQLKSEMRYANMTYQQFANERDAIAWLKQ